MILHSAAGAVQSALTSLQWVPTGPQEAPRGVPGGPRSGPKTAPRAARSAPRGAQEQPGAHQKGPKRDPGRPRSAKKPPGTPPGPILASFWGARGLISSNLAVLFEARARSARQSKTLFEIRDPRSEIRRTPPRIRDPRSEIRDPRSGIRDQRSRKTSLFTNPTCLPDVLFDTAKFKNLRFLRGSVLSKPFFAHPWLPEARNHTKMLFEITCQKVLRDSCGTEAHKDHGSVAGFWGRMPHWIRPPSLEEVVLGRRGACWLMFGL